MIYGGRFRLAKSSDSCLPFRGGEFCVAKLGGVLPWFPTPSVSLALDSLRPEVQAKLAPRFG